MTRLQHPAPRPLAEVVRPTTWIESVPLQDRLGTKVILASETFQHTGSFKFRAAYQVASTVPQPRLIAASSGNFGQGLAYACRLLGKTAIIVMPDNSARVKVQAVRDLGAEVDLIDVRRISRRDRVLELATVHADAYVASAYDDPLVIAGNASLGEELGRSGRHFEVVLAPVGGGGLTSGLIRGLQATRCPAPVYGVEPLLANDAARSFRSGRIIAHEEEPQTLADGVRTLSLGQHNWLVLKDHLAGVVEVTEDQIRESARLLFQLANLKAEPTGALSLAGLLAAPDLFRNRSVCCVISGGNVDPEVFLSLLA